MVGVWGRQKGSFPADGGKGEEREEEADESNWEGTGGRERPSNGSEDKVFGKDERGKGSGKKGSKDGETWGRFNRNIMALGEGPWGEVTGIQATNKVGTGVGSGGDQEGGKQGKGNPYKAGLMQGE